MPVLGHDPENNQPIANAYSVGNGRQLSVQSILLMIVAAFVLRNILFRVSTCLTLVVDACGMALAGYDAG